MDAFNDSGADGRVGRPRPLLVILTLMVAQLASADGITGIYVALPTIYREFPADGAAVGWIVTAFFLMAATTAALTGRLADLLGRSNVAVALLLTASAGAMLGALASSVSGLICASLLLGAAGGLTPILIGLAREQLSPERLGVGIGAIAAAGSAGSGLIFLAGGALVDRFGRVGGYSMTVVLDLFAALLLLVVVSPKLRRAVSLKGLDLFRGMLFGPAIGLLMLSAELTLKHGWSYGLAPALLVGSIMLLIYWARSQLHHPRPLIDVRLMFRGGMLRVLIAMLLLGIAGIQQGQMLSLLLQQQPSGGAGFGLSATGAGLTMLVINSTAAFTSPLAGAATRRLGGRIVAIAGSVAIVLSWIALAFAFHNYGLVIGAAVINLIGLGMLLPAIYVLVVEAVPADLTSGATGLGYTLFDLGFAIGSQVILTVLMSERIGAAAPGGDAYRLVFLWLAGGSLAMFIAIVSVPRRKIKEI